MAKLLTDSDSDVEFSVNKEYAENYNKWREKEELQKLKDRYGEDAELDPASSTSSSEESEDEEGVNLTPEFEKGFLKTLSLIKSKDPRIYDKNVTFFNSAELESGNTAITAKKKKNQDEPLYIRDYERKVIVEKQGVLSDEEHDVEDRNCSASPTYLEEQQKLKQSFQTFLQDSDDEDADDLLKERKKTKQEEDAEEEEYLKWLKGEKEKLSIDKELESDLKPLHDYWNDPALDSSELFLRDYVLNKRHVNKDETESTIPSYEEIINDCERLSEDEATLEQQAEFEHKYNFRFEEPDPEFIKRFPRTIKDLLRKKNESRKMKREVLRNRKQQEKLMKQEELKRLKALKRKEIMEKIEELKEITGNTKIGFDSIDLSCDFDPEKYDEQMKKLFDDEYYAQEEGDQKPVFPMDEEIDYDDEWPEDMAYNDSIEDNRTGEQDLHCDDPDFNMDADYNPDQDYNPDGNEIAGSSKSKKRKRKSKFAEAIEKNKETIAKEKKSLLEAFDEYYKLDYCDMIGDTPIRFRYREVEPNDFGLSTEEILLAKDKELNQWCSLKKTCQYRSREEECYDVQAFKKKSLNTGLKQKILASIYQERNNEEEELPTKGKRKRKKRKRSQEQSTEICNNQAADSICNESIELESEPCTSDMPNIKEEIAHLDNQDHSPTAKRKRKKKNKKCNPNKNQNINSTCSTIESGLNTSVDRLKAFGINPKKVRNKMLYGKKLCQ